MTDPATGSARAIEARDESPHEHGGEAGWTERYTFDFFDGARNLGGVISMEFVPGERRAESTVSLFLPEGAFATALAKAPGAKRADLAVGRLKISMAQPLARWTLSCKDVALVFPSARAASLPETGRERHGAAAQIGIDLAFDALAPPAGSASRRNEMDANRFLTIVSSGWFAQPGRYRGTVRVGNRSFDIDARGFRERTWGMRAQGGTVARVVFRDDLAIFAGTPDGTTTVFGDGTISEQPARASAGGAGIEIDGIGVVEAEPLVTIAGESAEAMARFTAPGATALGYVRH